MKKRHLKRKHITLRKDLGLLQATAAGVGIIVGAGIYVLIGAAAGLGGNAVWISFLISAIVALFTGLSYAELSSMFPDDAGEYIYVENAFKDLWAFLAGYSVFIAGIISAAAVALGLAGYFNRLIGFESLIITAIAAIVLFSLVNYYGIKESSHLNILFTALEVGGLIFIILLGLKYIGRVNYLEMAHGFKGVLSAASLIFFAFIGFESVVKLSDETKDAKRIIPKALMLSIIITTIIYVLVAISAVSIIGWEQLAMSKAPLADLVAIVFGSKAFLLLAIIAIFSTGNTILIILVTTSRILYGMGDDIKRLKIFSKISEKRRTPYVAVFFVMITSILFVLIGKIEKVAGVTNFAVFFTFILVNASLIKLRYKKVKVKRGFTVPLNIGKFPVLALFGILTSLFMLFNLEGDVIIGGVVLMLIGLVLYYFIEKVK